MKKSNKVWVLTVALMGSTLLLIVADLRLFVVPLAIGIVGTFISTMIEWKELSK